MKKYVTLAAALLCLLALAGCNDSTKTDVLNTSDVGTSNVDTSDVLDAPKVSKLDNIPFGEDQLYAVAYLGYEGIEDLSYYTENYLDNENLPIHYISKGEYYLIIPRYADMAVRLYRNDMETTESILVYEEMENRPFIIQCNESDIFSDTMIRLSAQTETVEFSPYISLMDGSVEVGDRGLDITHDAQ